MALAPRVLQAQSAPVIAVQPKSQTVSAGAAVTLTVAATGSSLTYQWSFNGSAVAGATASSFAIPSAAPANAGAYTVVVASGSLSTTSSTATLLVYVPYVVRTLAGVALETGSGDGPGAAAGFRSPQGIAADSSGNLYVSDSANHTIRKITSAGVVSTLAGTPGVPGTADGTGPAARFFDPTGIAVDAAGNVYVADTFNSTIRKITPAGVVSTLAGLAPTPSNPDPSNRGSANGTGPAARFNSPRGLAVDGSGNVYVADTLNSLIRKITPAGVVTTVAGNAGANPQSLDGTGAAANFDYPFGIASDSAGDLWVADTSGQTIRAVTPGGVVTTYAGLAGNGGSAGGSGTVARFNAPAGIAVDGQGNLYVADSGNSTVREITAGGVVATLAGLAGNTGSVDASGSAARLFNPYGIAVDGAGNVYVADTLNSTVREAAPQLPSEFAPAIQTQPVGLSVLAGATVTLAGTASGNPLPTYQWELGGAAVAGATSPTLVLADVTPAQAGVYTLVATNAIGSAVSGGATLTVTSPPAITAGPQGQTVNAGANVTLTATVTGAAGYQWQLNGAALPGATGASLSLPSIGTLQAGNYTVVATNAAGSVTSAPATVAVNWSARLVNLSARAGVTAGSGALITGFSVEGPAAKSILLRAVGPGLAAAPFDVAGALADPRLTLVNSAGTALSSSAAWGGGAALAQVFSQVGAFPLAANSADAAAVVALSGGAYTVQVGGVGNTTGVALAEIYDADTGSPPSRLANTSARAVVGTGASVLVAGFVIAGTTSETVLIRADGPALAASPFNLSGTLAKPVLTVQDSSANVLATNSGWGGGAALSGVFALVGAFPLASGSSDAALVVTLPPGAYTATVSGAGATTGIALVEVYEVP
jgi:sugar lactone lactonase YvrE